MTKLVNEMCVGVVMLHFAAGYDSMGYHLSKPRLRAELESDLKQCVTIKLNSSTLCINWLMVCVGYAMEPRQKMVCVCV